MPAFTKAMLDNLGLTPAATTLQAVPPKEKGKAVPHTMVYHKNAVHQADLIFLPHDKWAKRRINTLRLVVDLHSGATDAEPLEDKTAEATAAAIKSIYRRSILDFPNRLETDPGSEFKSVFAAHMVENNVELRYRSARRVDTDSNQWSKIATMLSATH